MARGSSEREFVFSMEELRLVEGLLDGEPSDEASEA